MVVAMKMVVRIVISSALIVSLMGFIAPYIVLASEHISLKSSSKKTKEQTYVSSTSSFDALTEDILTYDAEENVQSYYYQLAVQEEKEGRHDQAAFYYDLALSEGKNHYQQDTSIVNTNDDAIQEKSDFEELVLETGVVASDLSMKSRPTSVKQPTNQSNAFDAISQKTPNHSLSNSSFDPSDKANKSAKIAVSSLMNDIVAVTEAELDLRLTSYHQLIALLEERLFSSDLDPGGLKGRWRSLWSNHAKAPENLISKKEIKKLLKKGDHHLLDENHTLFSLFKVTDEVLFRYERDLCAYLPEHAISIKDNFYAIKKHYQEFVSTLIKLINGHNKAFYDNDINGYRAYKKQIDAYIGPKAFLVSALQPGSCYRISQKKALKILGFNERGERGELKAAQNHHVSYMAPKSSNLSVLHDSAGVYFKNDGQPSLQPGREAMVYHLYSLLKIPLAETGLVFIDTIDFQDSSINNSFFESGMNTNPFCVQASREIKGERADSFLKEHSYYDLKEMLDVTAYFWQVLGALITYPSDGKTENFIVKKLPTSQDRYELVSIDNDAVFESPIKNNRVNLVSLLLTLPQMEYSLSSSLKEQITRRSPDILMLEWLLSLQDTNKQYDCLFKQLCQEKKRQNYCLHPDSSKSKFENFKHHLVSLWQDLSLPLDLRKHELALVLKNFKAISSLLCDDQKITLDSILKELEPALGEAYEVLRKTVKDPYECVAALYGAETPLYVAEGGKKKFGSLSEILGRTVLPHEYCVWAEEDPQHT